MRTFFAQLVFMIAMNPPFPFSKESLVKSLNATNQQVRERFSSFAATEFVTRPAPAEWSPAENLDHVIRSVGPVARAMQIPKVGLQFMFGKSNRLAKSFEEIRDAYLNVLAKGATASGRYVPEPRVKQDADAVRRLLLQKWDDADLRLMSGIEHWSESALDAYVLPHPLLGKLTVREILFFTLYHNSRHAAHVSD